jgi:hypothetical protein
MPSGPVPDGMCRCCWKTDNMGEPAIAGTPLCAECWETCAPDMPPGVFEAAAGSEPG